MNQRRFIILLLAMIISSFLGGMSVQLMTKGSLLLAKEDVRPPNEIRIKALHLVGHDDKIRASFYLGIHDTPQLVLYDKEGTNRFNFGLAPAGNPGMTFNNENFENLLQLDTKYNRASITLWDSQNKIVWRVP